MNFREGLERINTVWWGFWGLLAFVVGFAILFNGRDSAAEAAGIAFGGIAACWVAHRAMRWIIRGFFPVHPQ